MLLGRSCVTTLLLLSTLAVAQEKPEAPRPKPGELKPYDQVITKEAKSESGLFKVHRIGDKVYFEVPASALGRDMLWSTEIAELPAGVGYGGTQVNDSLVRWSRRVNKLYLHTVDTSIRAVGDPALEEGVRAASLPPIAAAFDVETEGEGKSAVVDVTRLFTSDPPEFAVKGLLGGTAVDANRSYIDRVKAFPSNIETRSMMTFNLGGAPAGAFGGGGGGRRTGSASALVHYSLVLLPEKPMMGRLLDSRVGYFSVGFEEYGHPAGKVKNREYITRYRLEKKDPSADISEPVKPIVYYIAREVPAKWRPYIKQGVEDWQAAYEKAGFSKAIIAKDAPSKEEDPTWDPEDVRYSTIRWAPTPTENAMGPHVNDPRSGEIMSAHIIMWHNILKLLESWYFTQASPMDPRAQKLPFPDELMGELVRYVVAHEVGHTLGLQHNFKASSSYTIAQLRSPSFTKEFGNEASIMDYGRFNYVAQPGDGARLIPMIGPYDHFAIEWGYKPITAASPDGETPELDRIAARQVSNPMLRFGNSRREDPTQQTEDLGNDPIEATRLGLLNLDRVMKLVLSATSRQGEDYTELSNMYARILGQRSTELRHVVGLVGGVVETDYHYGRGGAIFTMVPKDRQQAAVKFLLEVGLAAPKSIFEPSWLDRIESSGLADRVLQNQTRLVATLLSDLRIKRMLDWELKAGPAAYAPKDMVMEIQRHVWRDFYASNANPDLYQRNLQRAHLEQIDVLLNSDFGTKSEFRAMVLAGLDELEKKLRGHWGRGLSGTTGMHVRDCLRRIAQIREPEEGDAANAPAPATVPRRGLGCWTIED